MSCCRPTIRDATHKEFQDVPAMVLASTNSMFGNTGNADKKDTLKEKKDADWRWNGRKDCGVKDDGDANDAFKHLEYLEAKFFATWRFFWGRGNVLSLPPEGAFGDWESLEARLRIAAGPKFHAPDDAGPLDGGPPEDPECQCGPDNECRLSLCCTSPGLFSDFFYYSANNHPLHGIFCHSPLHRLNTVERICMEITTIAFCFFTSHLKVVWVDSRSSPFVAFNGQSDSVRKYLFSLFVVTLPGMIIWRFNWMAFTAPCFLIDGAKNRWVTSRICSGLSNSAEVLGYMFCMIVVAYIVFDLFYIDGMSGSLLQEYGVGWALYDLAFTRAQGYILEWAIMLGLYFNPCISWGHSDVTPGTKSCVVTYVADNLALGHWRIQKQEFQNNCIHALERIEKLKAEAQVAMEEAPEQQQGFSCRSLRVYC